MKVHKLYIAFFLLGIFAVSCSHDPIFFIISTETAPKPPRIEGAPTNMVVFERNGTNVVYVASGRIHSYARTPGAPETNSPRWDLRAHRIPSPGGKIISLAVTKDRLYALCLNGESLNATLHYIGHSGGWERVKSNVSGYPFIQSIYTDPETNRLFAGARKRDSTTYALLYLDDDDTWKILRSETAMLTGIVCRKEIQGQEEEEEPEEEQEQGQELELGQGQEQEEVNIFYLCTNGRGIFRVSETDLMADTGEIPLSQLVNMRNGEIGNSSISFMGMIKLEDEDGTIIAVERNGGGLYEVFQDNTFSQMRNSSGSSIRTGRFATGALALWEDTSHSMKKLVAGIQGGLFSTSSSSYTNGYVEFDLLYPSGAFDRDSPRRDSNRLQTVNNTDRYSTSLGKHPINHLFQAPPDIDINMTFFASTQTAGLWSYKDRPDNGGWQWNAEE
jgi:hypothetical protein